MEGFVMFTIVIMKTYVVAPKRDIRGGGGGGVISRMRGLPKRVEFRSANTKDNK